MSDKGNINLTNKAFTDFAWSEMEQILDKEMPVGKKKRILAWYWLAAGVLLMFTLSILISQPKQNTNLITKTTPIKNINNNLTENSTKFVDNNAVNLSQKRASLNTKTAKNKITTKKSQKLSGNNTTDLSQKRTTLNNKTTLSSTNPTQAKTQTPADISTSSLIIDKNQGIKELLSTKAGSTVTSSLLAKEEKIASFPTTKVNTITSPVVYTESNEPLATYAPLSRKDILSTINTTIFTKGQTTSFTEINGYEAGILFTKNINHRKWSVGVGLSFAVEIVQLTLDTATLGQHALLSSLPIEQDDLPINGNILFDISPMASVITGSPPMGFLGLFSNASAVNVQLQYVSLPILVNYKWSTRIKMYAGVSPSFLIKSKIVLNTGYIESLSSRKNEDAYTANQEFSLAANSSIPLEHNTLLLTSKVHAPIKINRFKLPIQLGINYQLSKHFGLTLDATANLQHIIKQDFIKTDFGRFKLGGYWKF